MYFRRQKAWWFDKMCNKSYTEDMPIRPSKAIAKSYNSKNNPDAGEADVWSGTNFQGRLCHDRSWKPAVTQEIISVMVLWDLQQNLYFVLFTLESTILLSSPESSTCNHVLIRRDFSLIFSYYWMISNCFIGSLLLCLESLTAVIIPGDNKRDRTMRCATNENGLVVNAIPKVERLQ